ncbi:hypothetical protein ACFQZS_04265 [Mucilaginibacter calamicampi]|uniref:Uncharacterized protein n=1 Tax=Mucilaginibacter calamicampi TaxID=1302352 RepID=A0ABW2YSX9_9SPHI
MKYFFAIALIFIAYNTSLSQSDATQFRKEYFSNKNLVPTEYKRQFASTDLSRLWMHTENKFVYGFIGENFQRLRIKFVKVIKDSTNTGTYHVFGKTMVKNNINDFEGTINVSAIKKYRITGYGVDDEFKNKGIKGQFIIIGDYTISEDKKQLHSGVFSGAFATSFYLDKNNKVYYDDIELNADGYSNNEFVGTWIQYGATKSKKCNWGDYRIPYGDAFDIGAGEFSPNSKYFKFGWENFEFINSNNEKGKRSKQQENARWW